MVWNDSLAQIPGLPLDQTVLLPEAQICLEMAGDDHRTLIDTALQGNRLLAVSLRRSMIEQGLPLTASMSTIGCLGEIIGYNLSPSGPWEVVIKGLSRIRIEREVTRIPFSRLNVTIISAPQYLNDCVGIRRDARLLRILIEGYIRFVPDRERELRKMIPLDLSASVVADLAAAYLISSISVRQRILEAIDVKHRLGLVNAALAGIISLAGSLRGGRYDTPPEPGLN